MLAYIRIKHPRTSLVKSNSGWGFPSVSHFMVTVSPSLTGSVLTRVKVAFSEGSGWTKTGMGQVKIPPLDTFTLLDCMSSIRDVQHIPGVMFYFPSTSLLHPELNVKILLWLHLTVSIAEGQICHQWNGFSKIVQAVCWQCFIWHMCFFLKW